MSTGKYSPVWKDKPMVDSINGQPVDDEGYDEYGYNPITGKDREGFTEDDYLIDPVLYEYVMDYSDV